jgi:hypothetical protein
MKAVFILASVAGFILPAGWAVKLQTAKQHRTIAINSLRPSFIPGKFKIILIDPWGHGEFTASRKGRYLRAHELSTRRCYQVSFQQARGRQTIALDR